jgi:hypothetical protein
MDGSALGADKPSLGQVIGRRELRFLHSSGHSETVTVSLGAPVQRDGTWWCPLEIASPSFCCSYALAGEDSMQALLASASILRTELEALARQHKGAFTYFGEKDLVLPSMDWLKREGDAGET